MTIMKLVTYLVFTVHGSGGNVRNVAGKLELRNVCCWDVYTVEVKR